MNNLMEVKNMVNWTNACRGDLKRLDAIKLLLNKHSWMVGFLFHPTKPELRLPVTTIHREIGVLSHGEQILARIAMDLWSDTGKAAFMDLGSLDCGNFRNVFLALQFLRGSASSLDELQKMAAS